MSNRHAVHHSTEAFVETLSWSVWYACSLPQCRSSLAPSHRTNQPVPPFSGLPLAFSLLGVPYNIHSAALCTLPDFRSHSSFTASATSAASTALHDLLVPAAPETSEYSGRSAEMVNRSKYCAFHKHDSPRKASQSRARSMTISVILNRQSSHSSLHVIRTLCKTSKQPHSSTSAQRCVAAIESTAD